MSNENIITHDEMQTITETQLIISSYKHDYKTIHSIMQTLIMKIENQNDDIPRIIIKTLKNAYITCIASMNADNKKQSENTPGMFLSQILTPENRLKNMITLNEIQWLLSDECLALIGNNDYKPSKQTMLKALLCKHYRITLPDAESYSSILLRDRDYNTALSHIKKLTPNASALSLININDDYETIKLKASIINKMLAYETSSNLDNDELANAVILIHEMILDLKIQENYNQLLIIEQTLDIIIKLNNDYDNIIAYAKSANDDDISELINIIYGKHDRIWMCTDALMKMISNLALNHSHVTIPCIIICMLFIADYADYIEPFKDKSLSKHNMLTLLKGIQSGYPSEFINQQVLIDYNNSILRVKTN